VRSYQNLLDRREDVGSKLAEWDAKLAALGDTTRDYFAKANAITRWSGFGVRRDVRTDKEIVEPVSPYTRRGLFGDVIDEPPIGCDKRPVVPAEEWEAVKQYRELYLQRQGVAGELDNISRDLCELVAKNPALSFVHARKPVAA
jgi:hypothetical protein